jgi:hypothetical protein
VVEEKVDNPPADSSAIRVKLVEVINRYESMDAPAEPAPMPSPRPAAKLSPSADPRSVQPPIRGVLSAGLGPETRAFRPCGAREEIWVSDSTGGDLWMRYRELAGGPNKPVFVEVHGSLEPAPDEGFGAHYAQQLTVTQVVESSPGTTGCDIK